MAMAYGWIMFAADNATNDRWWKIPLTLGPHFTMLTGRNFNYVLWTFVIVVYHVILAFFLN